MNLDPHNVRTQIDNLKARFPEVWEDDDLLSDMLEGSTELHEFLTRIEDRRQHAVTMSAALATRIADCETRQKRYENQEQAMRALALSLMQQAGVSKVELPEATLSIRKGAARIVVVDDASVPDDLCKFTRTPDKTKIKALIDGGASPNWAVRDGGADSLSVRTK